MLLNDVCLWEFQCKDRLYNVHRYYTSCGASNLFKLSNYCPVCGGRIVIKECKKKGDQFK